jgi:hypothetical protein
MFEYDQTGWNCKESQLVFPSWQDIEAALRRLDKFRFPFVWYFALPQVEDDAVPEFEVMGGAGDYLVSCSVGGYLQRQCLNPTGLRPDEDDEVDIWTSDQGLTVSAARVLNDIEKVLRITRYFCETGGFDPSVPWDDGRLQ